MRWWYWEMAHNPNNSTLFAILLVPFLLTAATPVSTKAPSTVTVTGLTATSSTVSMAVGEKKQLAATKAGAPVNWVSSDAHIATVINSSSAKLNGMVIAHKPGTATIVASDHSETKVTVTGKAVPAKQEKKKK